MGPAALLADDGIRLTIGPGILLAVALVAVAVLVGLVLLVVLVLAPAVRSVTARLPAARPDPLLEWAQRAGWSHVPTDPVVGRGWRGWPFRSTLRWAAVDLCAGAWAGRRALAFRYQSPEDHTPGVVAALELPALLPFLELTPHVAGRVVLRSDLAVPDLDLESAAFNRHWRVATEDARFAHALLHPRVMERLLGPDCARLSLSVEGRHLVSWAPDRPTPGEVERHLTVLSRIADAVPDFVWQDHGRQPGPGTPPATAQERAVDQLVELDRRFHQAVDTMRIGRSPTRAGLSLRRIAAVLTAGSLALVALAVGAFVIGGPTAFMVVAFAVVPVLGVTLTVRAFPRLLRRHAAVQAWARAAGWTVVGEDRGLADRWRGTPFGGGAVRAREVLRGRWAGRSCVSFSCRRGGDDDGPRRFHVVAMALPGRLPTLELTPEGAGDRVAKALGGRDLELESADFNREWRVRSSDDRIAHAVLTPRVMARLLERDARGLSLRFEGSDLVTWLPGDQDLDAIVHRLRLMGDLVAAVPDFVWQVHGQVPAPEAAPYG